jgi:hypothetical protein
MLLKQTVRNGVDLLNLSVTGWANKIDLSSLYLGACSTCIIGQLFPESKFEDSLLALGLDIDHAEQCNYGFSCPESLYYSLHDEEKFGATFKYFNSLTEEWKRVILEIRNGENTNDQIEDQKPFESNSQVESESCALV